MNHATMFAALAVVASLSACQKPAPVNVPPAASSSSN
jgi:predicted small lipoprotein YifL